jgi:hypothetical protein
MIEHIVLTVSLLLNAALITSIAANIYLYGEWMKL